MGRNCRDHYQWRNTRIALRLPRLPRCVAAYQIQYPASGDPALAEKMHHWLQQSGIAAKLDNQRGFDHGLYVPLKIMFPDATIPCIQLSLLNNLSAAAHIAIDKALIIGSGSSFHNLRAFFSQTADASDPKNEAFAHWLINTCTNPELSVQERETRLTHWNQAPFCTLLPSQRGTFIATARVFWVFPSKCQAGI